MSRPKAKRAITTTDIDLAAAYLAITGRKPTVHYSPGDALVSFRFFIDEPTREVIIAYGTGDLTVNCKRFAACRAWLYRQAKEVRP